MPSKNGTTPSLKALIPFMRPYRLHLVGAVIALIFTSLVTLSIGQGVRQLIDGGLSNGSSEGLTEAVLFFLMLVVLLASGTFCRFYLVSWLGERVTADLRKAVYNHVIHLDPGFFESNASGDIQSRITTDTTLIQTVVGSSVSIALRNALMLIGGIAFLFVTNAKFTLILLLVIPVVLIPIIFFGRRVRALSRHSQDRIADVGSLVNETLSSIKVLQAFNHQHQDSARFSNFVEDAFSVAIRRIIQRSALTFAVIILVFGSIAGLFWLGGQAVLSGEITGGELAAFVFYAVIVGVSTGSISEVMGDVQRAAGATERLIELLELDSAIQEPINPCVYHPDTAFSLKFDHVSFSYPTRPDHPAVKNITCHIAQGETVALVGPSGAGKSTLFDLILRFYDVSQGSIALSGVNIKDVNTALLRQQIALVPQQAVLFAGTIADNIRYGFPAEEHQVIAAAKAAHANEFIDDLAQGYQAWVGESGVRLSGGQRQRIALARAILRQPKLLLLDEATSALDSDSEYHVQQALAEITKDRTTLIIAHRLATVIDADRIMVLEQGSVVATGTHKELLASCDSYQRWSKRQFQDQAID